MLVCACGPPTNAFLELDSSRYSTNKHYNYYFFASKSTLVVEL